VTPKRGVLLVSRGEPSLHRQVRHGGPFGAPTRNGSGLRYSWCDRGSMGAAVLRNNPGALLPPPADGEASSSATDTP